MSSNLSTVAADLVIRGGTLVTPQGRTRADLAARGGRIVAIGESLDVNSGANVIDASGLMVMPGVVDPEAHLGVHRSLPDDFASESRAAAAAGITTWGIQITTAAISKEYKAEKSEADLRLVSEVMPIFVEIGDNNSYIDYFLTPSLNRDEQAEEIPAIAEEFGVTSFKFHLHTKRGAGTFSSWEGQRKGGHFGFDDGVVFLAMEAVASLGKPGIVSIHPENWEIVRVLQEKLQRSGRRDTAAWNARSPHFCEAGHVRTYAYYARLLGCPLYIQHLTTPESVQEIRLARAEGASIVGQCAAHYLTLTEDAFKLNVPLRSRETTEEMWSALAQGDVDCIGSDHVCHTAPRSELSTGDVWKDISGFSSRAEAELPLLLSEGVGKGRISFERLVEVCCEQPARTFGLFPKKGCLRIGSDADIVLVDLERTEVIRSESILSSAGWSAWEGWTIKGWPVMTILRGEVVAARGGGSPRAEIKGESRGRYLRRFPGHELYPLDEASAG